MTVQRMEHVGVVVEDLAAAIAFVRTPDGHSRLELAKFHTPTAVSAETDAPANTPGIRHTLSSTRTAVGSATSAARQASSSSSPSNSAEGIRI
jgi:hypothetical protein